MDNRILMGLLGLITAIIIYIDIKKKQERDVRVYINPSMGSGHYRNNDSYYMFYTIITWVRLERVLFLNKLSFRMEQTFHRDRFRLNKSFKNNETRK